MTRARGYVPVTASERSRRSWVVRRANLDARFWDRVDRSGGADSCWPWLGEVNYLRGGYGSYDRLGRRIKAHRHALELALGRPLGTTEFACHHCDNPPCCNPAHLFAGTHKDNMADARSKGSFLGSRNGAAKLDEDRVRLIREALGRGVRHQEVANRFGVAAETIGKIGRRKLWLHV